VGSIGTEAPLDRDREIAMLQQTTANDRRKRHPNLPAWQEPASVPSQFVKAAILVVLAVVMLFPFVYVVSISFSSTRDILEGGVTLFPRHPTLNAYRAIFRGNIVSNAMIVSIWLTLVGTLVNMVMTITMAYGLSRSGVPGRTFVLIMVLFTMLFSPGIIPSYLLVKELGLLDSYTSLILPGAISAFNLIVMRNFFMSLPQEIIESARLDGASDWQLLKNIVIPLSLPVIAVTALFYGVAHWNDFFSATLYLNDQSKWPIQLVLRQYVLQGSSLSTMVDIPRNQPAPPAQTIQMAVVVVATVPILIVYPFLQRFFTKGVLTGAIKG